MTAKQFAAGFGMFLAFGATYIVLKKVAVKAGVPNASKLPL